MGCHIGASSSMHIREYFQRRKCISVLRLIMFFRQGPKFLRIYVKYGPAMCSLYVWQVILYWLLLHILQVEYKFRSYFRKSGAFKNTLSREVGLFEAILQRIYFVLPCYPGEYFVSYTSNWPFGRTQDGSFITIFGLWKIRNILVLNDLLNFQLEYYGCRDCFCLNSLVATFCFQKWSVISTCNLFHLYAYQDSSLMWYSSCQEPIQISIVQIFDPTEI